MGDDSMHAIITAAAVILFFILIYHVLLFMKAVILQQKVKYAYGYKFNATRMKEQIIILPTKGDGSPDYDFMEQYMKRIENSIIERISPVES